MIDALLDHPAAHVALLEPDRGRRLTYGELRARVDTLAGQLSAIAGGRALVHLAMDASLDSVLLYLACLRADLPTCLPEPRTERVASLAEAYAPAVVVLPPALEAPPGYGAAPPLDGVAHRAWRRTRDAAAPLHPDLALLLTTSGSTGSPKLVRLSRANLESNARSIAEYLELGPSERAVQSLPPHYSYGLSVINSHLLAGGSVAVTSHSFMRPEFWAVVDALECTSFAGVPYMYETLHRLRFTAVRHPSLRTMTQAGGALRSDLIAHFHEQLHAAGRRLFIMYGQTEATARIAYVPAERLGEKLGSIGIAIPGGRLTLSQVDGSGLAELIYAGPNVMLGYAESVTDLASGDVQAGRLATGDLGTQDADGYFTITGRLKRFAKLFGRRVSLDDVERHVEAAFPVRAAAVDGGDRLIVYVAGSPPIDDRRIAAEIAAFLGVPPAAVAVRAGDALPMTAAGKKDYAALARAAGAPEPRSQPRGPA